MKIDFTIHYLSKRALTVSYYFIYYKSFFSEKAFQKNSQITFSIFMTGNEESLKTTPSTQGIDIYQRLVELRKRMYSSHYMSLVIQSKGVKSSKIYRSW